MSEQRSDDDLAALQAEVDRLRQLVGPSEQSYADLRQDLLAARDAAKGAEAAEGVYRGRVNELEAALADKGQCLPFEPPHFGDGGAQGQARQDNRGRSPGQPLPP